jgi:acyl-homoserine lactone acylase PvdQ
MRKSNLLISFVIVCAFLLLGGSAFWIWPPPPDLSSLLENIPAYNVRILRDTWGVPHIFGQTDADAAFGLAYAHAEDDFLTIQQTLLAARGQLASVYGKSAAPTGALRSTRIPHTTPTKPPFSPARSSSQPGLTRRRSALIWSANIAQGRRLPSQPVS